MKIIRKLLCKIFGHKLIIVNDIVDRNSKDRLCIRCGWNNFNNTSPFRYHKYITDWNGDYLFYD